VAAPPPGGAKEKTEPLPAGSFLEAVTAVLSPGGAPEIKGEPVPGGESPDEGGVGPGRGAPQPVVKVSDGQAQAETSAGLQKKMKETDRIGSA
jgi:hypothetical protein